MAIFTGFHAKLKNITQHFENNLPNEVAGSVLHALKVGKAQMAQSEQSDKNYDNVAKMLRDVNKDLEKMLEEMEKISVQATWMAYDMVVMRTNPALADSMTKLENAFMKCKEEVEKNWQEILTESKKE